VHRDIGIRDIGGPEVEKVGTLQVLEKKESGPKLSVCGDVWQRPSVVDILAHRSSAFHEY
jgi:hypothetical protein